MRPFVTDRLVQELTVVLLAALRIGPLFAFTPPFTLVRAPALARLILTLALAAVLVGGFDLAPVAGRGGFVAAAAGELALGVALALPLQLSFAAIGMAARALDIQAGFGMAAVIDPTTRAQTPLIAALFAYAAAAVFFATNGPHDVLAALAASFRHTPPGLAAAPAGIGGLLTLMGAVWGAALGVTGLGVLVLFLTDLVIAMLSRTLPQMNVLVLGFQVKPLIVLMLLPATLGLAGAAIVRVFRLALEAMLALA